MSVAINAAPLMFLSSLEPSGFSQVIQQAGQGMALEWVEVSLEAPNKAVPQENFAMNIEASSHSPQMVEKKSKLIEVVGDSREGAEEVAAATSHESLSSQYVGAVRARILSSWQSTGGGDIPEDCELIIVQGTGGNLVSVSARGCVQLENDFRDSLVAAALRAQPLPYVGYETVFASRIEVRLSRDERSTVGP